MLAVAVFVVLLVLRPVRCRPKTESGGQKDRIRDGGLLSFSCRGGGVDVVAATYGPVTPDGSCDPVDVTDVMRQWAQTNPGKPFQVGPASFPGIPPCILQSTDRELVVSYSCAPGKETVVPRRVSVCSPARRDADPVLHAWTGQDNRNFTAPVVPWDPDSRIQLTAASLTAGARPKHRPVNPLTRIGITDRVPAWQTRNDSDIFASPCSSAVSIYGVQPSQPDFLVPKANESTDGTMAQRRYYYQPAYWSRASGPYGGPYRPVASCPEDLGVDTDFFVDPTDGAYETATIRAELEEDNPERFSPVPAQRQPWVGDRNVRNLAEAVGAGPFAQTVSPALRKQAPFALPKETLRSRGNYRQVAVDDQCLTGVGCGLGSTWINPAGPSNGRGDAIWAHGTPAAHSEGFPPSFRPANGTLRPRIWRRGHRWRPPKSIPPFAMSAEEVTSGFGNSRAPRRPRRDAILLELSRADEDRFRAFRGGHRARRPRGLLLCAAPGGCPDRTAPGPLRVFCPRRGTTPLSPIEIPGPSRNLQNLAPTLYGSPRAKRPRPQTDIEYGFVPPDVPFATVQSGQLLASPAPRLVGFEIHYTDRGATQISATYQQFSNPRAPKENRLFSGAGGAGARTYVYCGNPEVCPPTCSPAFIIELDQALTKAPATTAGFIPQLGALTVVCNDYAQIFDQKNIKCCLGEASLCRNYIPRSKKCDQKMTSHCGPLCAKGVCSDPVCACLGSPLASGAQCFDSRCAGVPDAYKTAAMTPEACKGKNLTCKEWSALGHGKFVAPGVPIPSDCVAPSPTGGTLAWLKNNALLLVAIIIFVSLIVMMVRQDRLPSSSKVLPHLPPLSELS